MGRGDGDARAHRPVVLRDGSYLMSSADVYGSVLAGHRFVLILCDNEGYAVIDRLQVFTGGASFNNMLEDVRAERPARVDFAKHAEAMGPGPRRWTISTGSRALERPCGGPHRRDRDQDRSAHLDRRRRLVGCRRARGARSGTRCAWPRPPTKPAGSTRGPGCEPAGGRGRRPRLETPAPTIVDVADRPASRSPSCRSCRDAPNVSDEKRAAVTKAAEEIGYRPNAVARSLVRRRSYLIGVMVSDLHNPYFTRGDRRDPGGGPWLRVPRSVQHRWPRRRRGGRGVGHPPATPDRRHRDGRPGALIASDRGGRDRPGRGGREALPVADARLDHERRSDGRADRRRSSRLSGASAHRARGWRQGRRRRAAPRRVPRRDGSTRLRSSARIVTGAFTEEEDATA